MGKLKSTSAWFIADANVLIDYAKTSPAILGQVAKHIGPVYVAADVLEEVDQLDEAQCKAIGLTVVDGNLAQLTEASQRGGQLSFEDKLCLVLARDNGWTCLSNDGPLRVACKAQGVPVVWGLEIMLSLIEGGHLSAADAIEVAKDIHAVNPIFITAKILTAFQKKVKGMSAKK